MKNELPPDMAYDTKKLNVVFSLLSLTLLISVIWLALDDHNRDWKRFQKEAMEIKRQQLATSLSKIKDEKSLEKKELIKSLEKNSKGFLFYFRNFPLLDFMDPTLQVHGIRPSEIWEKGYFQDSLKEDRCITCHTLIDTEGYEDQPNPHKTHPRLDEFVSLQSKHPMSKMGCTVCHEGEGQRVSGFFSTGHYTSLEDKQKDWNKKYTKDHDHSYIKKMVPLEYIQASCTNCHRGIDYIANAPKLNQGHRLIEKFGCIGCHEFGNIPNPLTKIGPPLKNINSKLSTSFLFNYIWSPRSFNPKSRMPHFFNQSNNNSKEIIKKNMEEVHSIVSFLTSQNEMKKPVVSFKNGNAKQGKELIKSIGCLGCHTIEGIDYTPTSNTSYRGGHLVGLGSKLNQDWLTSWLIDPSSIDEKTIMPSFRLTISEARDIATFLLKNEAPQFAKAEVPPRDISIRDELLKSSLEKANLEKFQTWDNDQRDYELGKISIKKYGCDGCHEISDTIEFEKIGPDLMDFKNKPIGQLLFSDETVKKDKISWIKAHLTNPRRWDINQKKDFKDLLVMPNFELNKDEIEQIIHLLLSQTEETPYLSLKKESEFKVAGRNTLKQFNCYACHQIDGEGGDISQFYSDDLNEGPPHLRMSSTRFQLSWIKQFLKNPTQIRPWLKVKMPTYKMSSEQISALLGFFAEEGKPSLEIEESIIWEKSEQSEVKKLFNNLECTSCHSQGFSQDEPTAPDLRKIGKRIKKTWLKNYLENPHFYIPYTPMPNFWEGGEPQEPSFFKGSKDLQIDALYKYLIEIGHYGQ